jgi:hypothetical protein
MENISCLKKKKKRNTSELFKNVYRVGINMYKLCTLCLKKIW